MFGFRRRIEQAVAADVEPGEIVVATVYCRANDKVWESGLTGPLLSTVTGDAPTAPGAPGSGNPGFLVTATDRRVLIHAMNMTNARHSVLLEAFPLDQAGVRDVDLGGFVGHFELLRAGTDPVQLFVQKAWQRDAKEFVTYVNETTPHTA